MKRKKILFLSAALLSFFAFSFLMLNSARKIGLQASAVPAKEPVKVIIDAGHGGEDGGAVSGEATEKDINLVIAHDISDLLRLFGFETMMTRTDNNALSDEGNNVRQRKYNDMKKRLEIFNSSEENTIISIHQNKFPVSAAAGTQVFYSPNDGNSEYLAQRIQYSVKHMLQPDNDRDCKKAGKEIYLLKNAKYPAVLVECGFISNPEEQKKLLDAEYQKKLALSVAAGFIDYFNTK